MKTEKEIEERINRLCVGEGKVYDKELCIWQGEFERELRRMELEWVLTEAEPPIVDIKESTGLEFNGTDDYIEILPHHTIDGVDIPKCKWVKITSAQGMGDDVTVIHDLDVGEDYVHDALCSVECPLCGSRKIVVTIERELKKIRCKECGNTTLKYLKTEENLDPFNGTIDEPHTHICPRVLSPLEIMQRYMNPTLF